MKEHGSLYHGSPIPDNLDPHPSDLTSPAQSADIAASFDTSSRVKQISSQKGSTMLRVGIAAAVAYGMAIIHSGENNTLAAETTPLPATPSSLLVNPETNTPTGTPTPRPSASETPTQTLTLSPTRTESPTSTRSATPTRTRTAPPSATPPPTSKTEFSPSSSGVGGKGFTLEQGKKMHWTDGTTEVGYGVLRISPNGNSVSFLGADASTYTDTQPSQNPFDCYQIVPLSSVNPPIPEGRSDLLCAMPNTKSPSGAPEQLRLRLDQSSQATIEISNTTQSARLLWLNDGILQSKDLPAGTQLTTVDTEGKLTFFAAMPLENGNPTGISEILAAIPGASDFRVSESGNSTPTATITAKPTDTLIASPTPRTPTLTRTPSPTMSPTKIESPSPTKTPEIQGDPWPLEAVKVMNLIPVVDDLKYKRETNPLNITPGAGSSYTVWDRTIHYLIGGPGLPEGEAVVYELGHARQHKTAIDSGLYQEGKDDPFIIWLEKTNEGKAYKAASQAITEAHNANGIPLPWEWWGNNLVEDYSGIFMIWYTEYYPRGWFDNYPTLKQFVQTWLPETPLNQNNAASAISVQEKDTPANLSVGTPIS